MTEAGPSSADSYHTSQYVAQHCIGLSPNIIDFPDRGGLTITADGLGLAGVVWGNVSIWGYHTDGTVRWKNLRTGAAGEVVARFERGGGGGGFATSIHTGSGPVRFTTTAVNRGALLTLPAPTCTGTATIR
ncbi:hypothetical protein [Gordonia soli]|uniref:Uncharacterized protein n=1 Tax=Gordonia soli NBRC 108243 TaxID=1223545 RepID=M0QLY1_9ACTN|nr:hypothetical protein [Gordonia soli]GAC69588.1 hypothetical protein GS4_26_00360 [Gordonia soli NBRC 108243]